MGYMHMFYGVDLDRVQALFGSNDEAFVEDFLKAQAEELEDNDAFFEDEIEEGDCPSSETALREIVAGKILHEGSPAMYGYVLKIICEHLGESIMYDVYAVSDHPYKSQLASSGPPIAIPDDPADFPDIGHLSIKDIPAELQRIDAAPQKAKKSLVLSLINWASKGMIARQMDDDEAIEDMNAYRDTLKEAQSKNLSLVSFRH
ncbi:MAG: hypothetical protein COA78_02090 [Blastopirellula sp.]|nr:MAG: hypothetical protein COA78_02090 [Blastopirellula sp.]